VVRPIPFVGDDAALAAAVRDGHPGANAAMFDRFEGHVRRLIVNLIGPTADVADALQEVFLRAFRSIHTLKDPSALRPWLTRVAILTTRQMLRSRRRKSWLRLFVDHEDEERAEPVAPASTEAYRALQVAYGILDKLPEDDRIAFGLRFVEGMELSEAAAACGVSLATIKRRIHRAQELFMAAAEADPALKAWTTGGVP
jgi:RNA polymerase sigma-70 factor (ECF subfamily)